jgi:YggT family protein
MDTILLPLIEVVRIALNLYVWAIIISAILSWLIAFNVVNTSNQIVYTIGDFLYRITDPVLRPIRRFLPDLGGIDLSPLVVILGVWFLNGVLGRLAHQIAMG